VIEGVGRMLDPQLDMWRTSEPVVREWITRNLGPIGRIEEAGRGAATLAGALADLPQTVARGERLLAHLEETTQRGVTLSSESIAAIGKAEAKRGRMGDIAVWAAVALFAYALFVWPV
jgi:ubiquinone biosynthesis protein